MKTTTHIISCRPAPCGTDDHRGLGSEQSTNDWTAHGLRFREPHYPTITEWMLACKAHRASRSKHRRPREHRDRVTGDIASGIPRIWRTLATCLLSTVWHKRLRVQHPFTLVRSVLHAQHALLTGRNHHVNNAGAIMDCDRIPGNTASGPTCTPLAEMASLERIQHRCFRKYHETPPWEYSVSGPYTLAYSLRLRQVLWLHRRRNQPVGSGNF